MTATTPTPVDDDPSTAGRGSPFAAFAELGWDVGLPLAGYYGLRLLGASEWTALLVGSVVAGARLIWVALRSRRVTWFAALMLAVFGVGLALAFVSGDPRFLLVKESFGTGAAGVMFLLSLTGRRPLTFSAFRTWRPAEAAELDGLWDTAPDVRRAFRVSAIVWGIGLILEALVRVPLVYALSIDAAAGVSAGLLICVIVVLSIWNAVYARRTERRARDIDAS